MQIHVSNLHPNLIESDILRLFTPFGEVYNVVLMRDKFNNRSHGRAIIDMPVHKEATQAVISLNGNTINGKKLSVRKMEYDPAPNASWNISRNA